MRYDNSKGKKWPEMTRGRTLDRKQTPKGTHLLWTIPESGTIKSSVKQMHMGRWSLGCVATYVQAWLLDVWRSGAFKFVSKPRQGEKTSPMISEKQLLLHISLGRVTMWYPNHFRSIILQGDGLLRNGEHSRLLPNFPRSGHPSKFAPRSDSLIIREITKSFIKRGVRILHFEGHDSTIRKSYGEKAFHSKIRACKHYLSVTSKCLDQYPLDRWDEFGYNEQHHVWQKPQTLFTRCGAWWWRGTSGPPQVQSTLVIKLADKPKHLRGHLSSS